MIGKKDNSKFISSILICLIILPNILCVLLGLVGIKSYVTLVAYFISFFFMFRLNGEFGPKFSWSILFYFAWFYYTYSYTISKFASVEKMQNLLYMVLIPIGIITFAYAFCNYPERVADIFFIKLRKWSSYILIALALLLLGGFTEKGDSYDERATIIGMRDAIWCSRYVGFLIIPILIDFFNKRYNKIDVVGCLAATYIMISSGSRAPILCLLIVLLFTVFPKVKLRYKLLLTLIAFLLFEAFIHFSSRYSGGSAEYSDLERIELINGVLEAKFNLLYGVGIGGYNLYIKGDDTLYYPHNIFLETYIEAGIVGIVLLFVLLFEVYKNRRFNKYAYACFLFYFFNAMFSGDISANNYFFVFSAMIVLSSKCAPTYQKRINQPKDKDKIITKTKKLSDECCVLL